MGISKELGGKDTIQRDSASIVKIAMEY